MWRLITLGFGAGVFARCTWELAGQAHEQDWLVSVFEVLIQAASGMLVVCSLLLLGDGGARHRVSEAVDL